MWPWDALIFTGFTYYCSILIALTEFNIYLLAVLLNTMPSFHNFLTLHSMYNLQLR